MYYDIKKLNQSLDHFRGNFPYNHCVIDNFFEDQIAKKLEEEFLAYEDNKWYHYRNAIEDKKALNDWNAFKTLTYSVFRELISSEFISVLSQRVGVPLFQDPGLHGGGWHIHGPGGNLNPHLDYSIHPKTGMQRKINLIIYLSSTLVESHGGHLGLWSHDNKLNAPLKLEKEIMPRFNRAVIFDTTQNSWHGLSRPLSQPEGIYRKSIAIYYLMHPSIDADPRDRALFAPRSNQKDDLEVLKLIKLRADRNDFSKAYRSKD